MTTTPTSDPKRGEIWWVDFDPSVGEEQRKVRPALVLSVSSIGRLALRIVVPITTWRSRYEAHPWITHLPHDATNGLASDSGADAFQVKSISLERFNSRIGSISPQQLDEVIAGVALCIGFRYRAENP
jgi:mRNA interferase MazF